MHMPDNPLVSGVASSVGSICSYRARPSASHFQDSTEMTTSMPAIADFGKELKSGQERRYPIFPQEYFLTIL
jgi:hypothetical protein